MSVSRPGRVLAINLPLLSSSLVSRASHTATLPSSRGATIFLTVLALPSPHSVPTPVTSRCWLVSPVPSMAGCSHLKEIDACLWIYSS